MSLPKETLTERPSPAPTEAFSLNSANRLAFVMMRTVRGDVAQCAYCWCGSTSLPYATLLKII